MSRYAEQDVYQFLTQHGCTFEGDRYPTGSGWFAPDGMEFTIPLPVGGFFDADIIDRILSDRWIWRGLPNISRYPD